MNFNGFFLPLEVVQKTWAGTVAPLGEWSVTHLLSDAAGMPHSVPLPPGLALLL